MNDLQMKKGFDAHNDTVIKEEIQWNKEQKERKIPTLNYVNLVTHYTFSFVKIGTGEIMQRLILKSAKYLCPNCGRENKNANKLWKTEDRFFFNGGWAVLGTLCQLINSLIKKIKDNFRVYLECAHPVFLTT